MIYASQWSLLQFKLHSRLWNCFWTTKRRRGRASIGCGLNKSNYRQHKETGRQIWPHLSPILLQTFVGFVIVCLFVCPNNKGDEKTKQTPTSYSLFLLNFSTNMIYCSIK